MRRTCASLLLVFGLAACGDDLPDDINAADGMMMADSTSTGATTTTGEPPPSTTSTTSPATTDQPGTTGGGGTFGELDECQQTSDCGEGLLCVAPFDESLGPEGKGLNECVAECVVIMDETRWCLDADACCDPDAVCTDRGYCVFPGESTGGEESGSSDGGGSTDGGTSTG